MVGAAREDRRDVGRVVVGLARGLVLVEARVVDPHIQLLGREVVLREDVLRTRTNPRVLHVVGAVGVHVLGVHVRRLAPPLVRHEEDALALQLAVGDALRDPVAAPRDAPVPLKLVPRDRADAVPVDGGLALDPKHLVRLEEPQPVVGRETLCDPRQVVHHGRHPPLVALVRGPRSLLAARPQRALGRGRGLHDPRGVGRDLGELGVGLGRVEEVALERQPHPRELHGHQELQPRPPVGEIVVPREMPVARVVDPDGARDGNEEEAHLREEGGQGGDRRPLGVPFLGVVHRQPVGEQPHVLLLDLQLPTRLPHAGHRGPQDLPLLVLPRVAEHA
mmetsp:Transcript_37170/g.91485  ORF Transcript_37170/g.91485 Transcript_37170/m.91485 type:complete len:334 (-) Transcript_37170:118-1119(-)